MAEQLDKSKGKSTSINVEQAVVAQIPITPYTDEDTDDDLDLDVEQSDDDGELDIDEILDDDLADDEEKVAVKPIKLSKDARKIQALKNEAVKLQREKADLERKLIDKQDANRESELAKEYLEDGYDEKEATRKARTDIRQSNLEKQLEVLMFEKNNRKILAKYPDSENDLETIIETAKTGKMTVEQICRGLYGTDIPDREKRALDSLVGVAGNDADTTVSQSMRTASAPVRSSLTDNQLRLKRQMELKWGKMTDAQYLESYPS